MNRKLVQWCIRSTVITYLIVIVVIPIICLYGNGFSSGWHYFLITLLDPFCWKSILLTVRLAIIATIVNTLIGTLIAWVFVRYQFPGRQFLNSLVELPFALPTTIGGLMILLLLGPQSLIGIFFKKLGFELVFQEPAIVIAMIFVTFPFVIRTIQPLLEKLDRFEEEAAFTLGATRSKTFISVILPAIRPGITGGAILTFSRALAEFGAVVMVAGNIPGKTLVAPVYMYGLIENNNLPGAAAISIVLLTISFLLLWGVHVFSKRGEWN